MTLASLHIASAPVSDGPARQDGNSVFRLWSGLSPASKRLIAAGGGLLMMMVVAVSLTLWDMHRVAQNDVHQNVGKLGIAIAEQTTRSIQAVDLSLEEIRKDITSQGIDTPERFKAELRSSAVYASLRQKEEALPQAEAFTIIGADGRLVNSSRQWPIPPTDVSDRDYYEYFRDHDDPNPFISNPALSRVNGGWTVFAARRVNGPSGNFLGIVLSAIDLNYFRDFYKALTAGAGTTVTLLKQDGTALTSFPTTELAGKTWLPRSSPWYGIVARRQPESFVTQGALAPGLRVVSVHPLTDYPLVVNVSVSEWDLLANWRKAALLAAIGTGSALLCMIFLMRALTLQLQRLERSEASLAQQNAWLEIQAGELRASREHLARESAAFGTTLEHMNQGIMMVDADRTVAVCNTRVMQMLDLPAKLMDRRPSFDEVVAHQNAMNEFKDEHKPPGAGMGILSDKPFTYERKRSNGRILEIESVPLATGGMVRTYTDITERRNSEEQIRYFAHHDDMTKLVNRVVFQERLEHAIELANRSQRSIAVLYLDLDRFKLVNDTRGHAVGDKLLIQVAARLRGAVRDIDTVARMGGDEFAIIQPLIEQPNSSAKLAKRVLHLLNQPFDIDGARCSVGVSVGIALYPDHAATVSDLLRNADTALYRAKAEGRGVYRVFDESMDAHQQQLFALEQELRQALDLKQFELEYQPIVDSVSRRILCHEALLRWRHPKRGIIMPADFIGLAENSGLIIPIGLWVLESACAEATTWPEDIRVAVNLSPLQFNQESLVGELTGLLRRTGLAPDRLILEVTESLLLQGTSTVLGTMSQLRALGIRFSLDDFGTAHAGLSYLRRFPFDAIKIDKSFVQDMEGQPDARAIVAAVLGIGVALNLSVTAEGVETERQLADLQRMHCKQVQGYLTGRPQSAEQAREHILKSHAAQNASSV